MELIDTHCHVHFDNYDADREQVLAGSSRDRVSRIICVGCSLADSQKAIDFAGEHPGVWATAGAHPHDGADFLADAQAAKKLKQMLDSPKIVAVGEIGLDYYRGITPKTDQEKALRTQLEIGLENDLPFVFHVREAWEGFWPIFDSYRGIKGVIHSFSAGLTQLDEVLARGLYVGLNGLITYTKEDNWRESARRAPLDKILLETDAPFLTPIPFRGTRAEPKHVAVVAEFLAELRSESIETLAASTTKNAVSLFRLTDEKLRT